MNIEYVTALSALAGSAVGGLTTGLTSWFSLRLQARAGRMAGDFARRQDLFKDFIVAASNAYGAALFENEPKIQDIVALYALVNRMRVLCSPRITVCADKVIRETIDTYFAPKKTVLELNSLLKNGTSIDPLKEFSEAAREELRAFQPF